MPRRFGRWDAYFVLMMAADRIGPSIDSADAGKDEALIGMGGGLDNVAEVAGMARRQAYGFRSLRNFIKT